MSLASHQEFNAGLFDYLIATDDSETKQKEEVNGESNAETRKSRKHAKQKLDSEFGVVRGIDFKNVHTVGELVCLWHVVSGSFVAVVFCYTLLFELDLVVFGISNM